MAAKIDKFDLLVLSDGFEELYDDYIRLTKECGQSRRNVVDSIKKLKSLLEKREYRILIERFENRKTLGEVAKMFEVTRERIRQIEAKGLEKMKCYRFRM